MVSFHAMKAQAKKDTQEAQALGRWAVVREGVNSWETKSGWDVERINREGKLCLMWSSDRW